MTHQNIAEATEEWSMEILGVHIVEGTASDAFTSFIATSLLFLCVYGIFRLLRLRWGIYKSLCITILLAHIIPFILLWIIKYTLRQ